MLVRWHWLSYMYNSLQMENAHDLGTGMKAKGKVLMFVLYAQKFYINVYCAIIV